MRARPRRFFSALQLIELSPPLVKASRPYPELLGQFRDTLTGPHPLYSYALKLPGVSFPLHLAVPFPAKCALSNCLTSRVHSISPRTSSKPENYCLARTLLGQRCSRFCVCAGVSREPLGPMLESRYGVPGLGRPATRTRPGSITVNASCNRAPNLATAPTTVAGSARRARL